MLEVVARHKISPDMDFVQLKESDWDFEGHGGHYEKLWLALECRNGIEWYLPFEDALNDFMIQSPQEMSPGGDTLTLQLHEPVPTAESLQVGAVWWYAVPVVNHVEALEFYIDSAKFHDLFRYKDISLIDDDEYDQGGEYVKYPKEEADELQG